MANSTLGLDPKAFRDLKKIGIELDVFLATLIDRKTARRMGSITVSEAKRRIAKGVNPIDRWPRRYPPYKAISNFKKGVKQFSGREQQREAGRLLTRQLRDRYPFNVQSKFPNKKLRPVNLKLSGDMLDDLVFVYRGTTKRADEIEIKYKTKKSADKEKGHRAGVNKQPRRPSLPLVEAREMWINPIQNAVRSIVRLRIAEKIVRLNTFGKGR